MTARPRFLLVAVVAALGGCAVVHPPVPVEVDPGVGAALAGVWEGTYESRDTGRTGSLTFALSARADSAVGEVVMVPRGDRVAVRRVGDRWQWEGVSRPQVLTIRFVRLRGGAVVGDLDPYPDPDCGCPLQTAFQGEIDGDTVIGTFTSRAQTPGHDAEGTWQATRRSGPR